MTRRPEDSAREIIDRRAAGVIEAKQAGTTLSGVEVQSDKYAKGLSESLPTWHKPLPIAWQSIGLETRLTNGLDPNSRPTNLSAFHRGQLGRSEGILFWRPL